MENIDFYKREAIGHRHAALEHRRSGDSRDVPDTGRTGTMGQPGGGTTLVFVTTIRIREMVTGYLHAIRVGGQETKSAY